MTASRDVPTFLLAADFITSSEIKTLNFHTFGYKETHSATAKIKIKLLFRILYDFFLHFKLKKRISSAHNWQKNKEASHPASFLLN